MITTSLPNYINSQYASKSHTHTLDIDYNSLNTLPDYSRATLMCTPDIYVRKAKIFKINVPGYVCFMQNTRILDTDHVIFVASHPGYLYTAITLQVYIRDLSILNYKERKSYSNYRAIIGANALPGGDTYQSCMYLINPGLSTYILPTTAYDTVHNQYYRYIFIPCKIVPQSYNTNNYFECVGCSENHRNIGLYSDTNNLLAFISDTNIKQAFNGNWENNINKQSIKIYHLFVSGTMWNWTGNSYPHHNGSNIGIRFDMFDATATGKDRVWMQFNSWQNIQILYYNKHWVLMNSNNRIIYQSSTEAALTSNPWDFSYINVYNSDTRICTIKGVVEIK